MPDTLSFDEAMMQRALVLSMQGRVTAPPNPWVGCVIVKGQTIVGEGFHYAAGQPHAEINALQQAKDKTHGATAYVTLEPCAHTGRTPPCTQALINAKIGKVVIAVQDPDIKVSGKGIAQLRQAGIEVVLDVCKAAVANSLAPYLHQRRTGHPFCVAKAAISVDGRIAARDGSSQWISGKEACLDAHHLRAECQAIMVGAGTARIDRPALTVRQVAVSPMQPPLRIVLDAKGCLPPEGALFDTAAAPTLIITTPGCLPQIQDAWRQKRVEVAVVAAAENALGVDLGQVLDLLGSRGILQLLIEGGSSLLGSFLKARLLQQLRLYVGPRVLGSSGIPLFGDDSITTLNEAPQLDLLASRIFGNTVRIDYGVHDAYLL